MKRNYPNIALAFALSLTIISCGSSNGRPLDGDSTTVTDKAGAEPVKVKGKGENSETPLAKMLLTFFTQNKDMFDNNLAEDRKKMELDTQIEKEIAGGILNDMVFNALSLDNFGNQPEATFTFRVIDKDSTLKATFFVTGKPTEAIIAKFKDRNSYKLVGKITREKRTAGMPNIMLMQGPAEEYGRYMNWTTLSDHTLEIKLQDIILVEEGVN